MHPSFINWPSSNDKLQYPPQATSRCMARSNPMWQQNTKEETRQILKRSNIPRDLWKYYIEAPKDWDHDDYDKSGVHNGIRSSLMINFFQNVIPWWIQNSSLDRLVELKLIFTSVVQAKEEIDRFASKVMLNNHLDLEYKQEQASMLYKNLQTASEKLHAATNTVNTFG